MTDNDPRDNPVDPFLAVYNQSELRTASEFLTNWLPFLSKDLCQHCSSKLADRVRSVATGIVEIDGDRKPVNPDENSSDLIPKNTEFPVDSDNNNEDDDNYHDDDDTNSLGSWKGGSHRVSGHDAEASNSGLSPRSPSVETPSPRLSWADMAQEDELEEEGEEEERELSKRVVKVNAATGELRITRPTLSRVQREKIRFMNVKRNKDFKCYERFNGKYVNILEGLELHTGIFSAAEQKRIVDYVYSLQEMGQKGELKERTYTAPQKWMRGKGRVTIQFGCCYNYAVDNYGNQPGILQDDIVDPIPHLFKVIIRRLVKWHVLPPSCVPDSCIVNIYEEGDCIPPHIDSHDFVRPFCTVSFLSECDILFGLNIKVIAAGEFEGSYPIPLPVGSVLVLNGKGADVAKHCVPAVPTQRISITFRRMDESKRPKGYTPEPDLQDIQPLSFEDDRALRLNASKGERGMRRQSNGRADNSEMRGSAHRSSVHSAPRGSIRRVDNSEMRGFADRSDFHSEPRNPTWSRRGSGNRWNRGRVNANLGS